MALHDMSAQACRSFQSAFQVQARASFFGSKTGAPHRFLNSLDDEMARPDFGRRQADAAHADAFADSRVAQKLVIFNGKRQAQSLALRLDALNGSNSFH